MSIQDKLLSLAKTVVKADKYRKGVPPAFPESQPKYLQDELTKLEQVSDLIYDDVVTSVENGKTLKAAYDEEKTLRAEGDEALSQRITTLAASVESGAGGAAALVKIEETARVNADGALSQRITDLNSAMTTADGNLSSRITNEETARVNAVSAQAQRITDLTSSVNTTTGNLSSRITNEETARVNGDGANASAIQTLSSTVGGHTTTISQQSQTINGLSARWGIKIVNGNRVAGVQLNSAADGTSSFDIEANTFNLFKPGTNERYMYWDGAQLVVRGNILATSVTTDAAAQAVNSLPANTVSRPVVGKPTIVAQGTHYQNFNVGSSTSRVLIKIPTGVYVSGDWTAASTDLYIATATISAGTPGNGGLVGYSMVHVGVGDGINGGGTKGFFVDQQIYVIFDFVGSAGTSGFFNATAINWKLSRI